MNSLQLEQIFLERLATDHAAKLRLLLEAGHDQLVKALDAFELAFERQDQSDLDSAVNGALTVWLSDFQSGESQATNDNNNDDDNSGSSLLEMTRQLLESAPA